MSAFEDSYTILKAVINSPINVIIFALDTYYRYLAYNQKHQQTMKQIWGVQISLGTSMLDCIKAPEDRQKAKKNFDRALSGESFIIEEEYGDTLLERRYYENIYNPILDKNAEIKGLTVFLTDITKRKKIERERDKLIIDLQEALSEVKTLSGLLPICANCKKIRDDKGYWNQIDSYIEQHSNASFSHSMCPECSDKFYGNEDWYIEMKKKGR